MSDNFYFEFNAQKNNMLKHNRGISFEHIILLIESGKILSVKSHHNQKQYPNQHIIEINADEYIYIVPCVITGNKIFLKTIYPSRKANKSYKKGEKNA